MSITPFWSEFWSRVRDIGEPTLLKKVASAPTKFSKFVKYV